MAKQSAWISSRNLSVMLVAALTLVALLSAWMIKDSLENQTTVVIRNGITAQVPRGWLTQFGIEGESRIFTASDPFDANHSYTVTQLPVIPGGQLTDSVVERNLQRAQELASYKVLDQAAVKLPGSEGFRVTYVYVATPKFSDIPVVMMGVDFYQPSADRILVFSLEDQSSKFDEVYSEFIKFFNSIKISAGG